MLSKSGSISSYTTSPSTVSGLTAGSWVSSAAFESETQMIYFNLGGTRTGITLEVWVSDNGTNLARVPDAAVLFLGDMTSGAPITASGNYAAQVPQGVVYIIATTAFTGVPVGVTLSAGPAMDWLDVTLFGATGDGVTSDDVAIQTAIDASFHFKTPGYDGTAQGNLGTTLYFPPGIYNITNTLVPPSAHGASYLEQNLRFQGFPSTPTKSNINVPRSILSFSGAVTDSMMQFQRVVGFTLQDLGLTFTLPSYTGKLVDVSGLDVESVQDTSGILIQNCTFYPSPTSLTGCNCYLYLDGSETVVVSSCAFYGADYAIWGFDSTSGKRGYSNGVTIGNQTRFAKQNIAPILNPGEAWFLNGCVVEPNHANLAAFVRVDAGAKAKALSIIGCWMGDNRTNGPETWVEFAGQGLFMAGNHIEIYSGTTGLALQTLTGGNHGINVQSNQFYNSVTEGGVSGTAVDLGTAADYSDFVFLGNSVDYNILPIKSFNVSRSGSLFATPGGISISAGIVSFTPIPDPATTITATPTGSGSGPDGIYHYRLAFVTTTGETALGTTTGYADTSGTAQTITVSTTAPPTSSGVSAIKVYRTKAGPTSDYYYVGDMTGLSFTDSVPDSSLTQVCTYKSNTTAGKFFVGTNYAGGISGNNLSLGINALPAITYGVFNTAFGWSAGKLMTTGNYNSLFGTQAGNAITNGSSNSFFGYNAGVAVTTGSFNMLLGGNAGENITTGDYNLCFGYKAGVGLDGHPLTTGSYNTFLGAYSGPLGSSGGTLALAAGIGYGAMPGESHLMALGGTDTLQTKVVINGHTANAQLQINAAADTAVGVIVKANSSSTTADLQQWNLGDGTPVASVDALGSLSCAGLSVAVVSPTSGYTIRSSDYFVECSAASTAFDVTLPTAVGNAGRQFVIVRSDTSANALRVLTTGGQYLLSVGGNVAPYSLAARGYSITVISDGAQWFITSKVVS